MFCGIERVNRPPRDGDHDKPLEHCEAYSVPALQTLAPKGHNDEQLLSICLAVLYAICPVYFLLIAFCMSYFAKEESEGVLAHLCMHVYICYQSISPMGPFIKVCIDAA